MADGLEGNTRLIYVDPNIDAYGVKDKDGNLIQELSIPYEDLCITFNLIVQNFSRFTENKGSAIGSDNQEITISWQSTGDYSSSFLEGDDFGQGGGKYLSTYYTDISYENYGTKKIVEGLGVSSVEVSWESWYTPTVVIKFVDVRGSAIWGNEEAIHDEYGKVTADNIFGAFFTIPYPLFKLQMKGFLGKPVTFQLTLSDFRGEYNATVGNFEATATFIGYSYALLTDIPLAYIMAAPYCDYVGSEYWEKESSTNPDWVLYDNKPPIRLVDFFNKVKAATPDDLDDVENGSITDDESNELTNISNEKESLRKLKEVYTDFLKQLKANFPNHYADSLYRNNNGIRQILLMCDGSGESVDKVINDTTKKAYEEVLTKLNEHNSTYTDSIVSVNKLPNKWNKECRDKINLKRIFLINHSQNSVSFYRNSGHYISVRTLQKVNFNENRTLDVYLAEWLYRIISNRSENKKILGEYCYLVEDGFESEINSIIYNLEAKERKIKDNVARRAAKQVEKLVDIEPYIGNFFKILMCHLETFLHIMFQSYQDIKTESEIGLRTPSNLGITLEDTDIPPESSQYVVAWPKVINHGVAGKDGGDINTAKNSIGWVGDFSHNFVEEKVVLSIEAAIRKINRELGREPEEVIEEKQETPFPIVPSDLNPGSSTFQSVANNLTLSSLAGYVGIRAFQLLGVLCNSDMRKKHAKLLGKIDACNFYYCSNKNTIKEKIIDVLPTGDEGNTLIGIATCNTAYDNIGSTQEGNGKAYHDFERRKTGYSKSGRHPILVTSGNDYAFAYMYNFDNTSIIPGTFHDWNSYQDWYKYHDHSYAEGYDDIPYFEIKEDILTSDTNEWMNCVCPDMLLDVDNYGVNLNDYVNHSMFNIIAEDSKVNAILDTYDKLQEGSIRFNDIMLKEDFSDFLNSFWYVTEKDYYNWFDDTIFTFKRKEIGFDEEGLFPIDGKDYALNKEGVKKNSSLLNTSSRDKIYTSENGFKTSDGKNYYIEDLTIEDLEICTNNVSYTLYGSNFYYIQNYIEDSNTKMKVKALLFLHSLNYKSGHLMKIEKSSKNNGGFEIVPYGYLLFLGCLLWRESQEKDPIIWYKHSDITGYDFNYVAAKQNQSLYIFNTFTSKYCFGVTTDNNNANYKYISSFTLTQDINVKNQLILFFEKFALSDIFKNICNTLELKLSSGYQIGTLAGKNLAIPSSMADQQEFYNMFRKNFKGWEGVYRFGDHSDAVDSNWVLLFEETNPIVDIIKEIYTKKCIVVDGCWRSIPDCLSQGTDSEYEYCEVKIGQNVYKDYVSSFMKTLTSIVNNEMDADEDDESSPAGSEKLEENRDICINIYTYCKNLWDKWLTPKKDDDTLASQYNVNPFFTENFAFIDTYYCNVYDKLPLNCSILLNTEEALAENGMLLGYIDQIVSKHHCMFFSIPDFVGFANKIENRDDGWKNLRNMFKAVPYTEIQTILGKDATSGKPDNKFVIIYVDPSTSTSGGNNNFTSDSFDIWNSTYKDAIAPDVFKIKNVEGEDNYPNYYIPSFGVAVNKQNNHIFKGLKLSMNNPIMTEVAIQALENIYKKGGEGERVIAFHGQDIYNVYNNYSYICDVEMLGNAQIWPMMYFQLLNVPMWRGTYMIYKVKHTMTPGNMITTFSGMKLTKTPTNMAQSFYSIKGEYSSFGDSNYSGGYGSQGYSVSLPESYEKVGSTTKKYFDDDRNWSKVDLSKGFEFSHDGSQDTIRDLYNKLYLEIRLYQGHKEGDDLVSGEWNVMITSAYRGGDVTKSDHNSGYAIDLMSMTYNGSNWVKDSGNDRHRVFIALDIIYCNHRSEIRQLLLEYNVTDYMMEPTWYSNINCLHVAVKNSYKNDSLNQFMIAAGDIEKNTYKNINTNHQGDLWFLRNVPPYFRYTASRCWNNDKGNFSTRFSNYNSQKFTQEILTNHFSDILYSGGTHSGYELNNLSIAYKTFNNTFEQYPVIAICANIMRESGIDPTSVNKVSKAEGICQWLGERKTNIINYSKMNVSSITNIPLEDQVNATMKEMQNEATAKAKLKQSAYDYFLSGYAKDDGYVNTSGNINKISYLARKFMLSFERPIPTNTSEEKQAEIEEAYMKINVANIQEIISALKLGISNN